MADDPLKPPEGPAPPPAAAKPVAPPAPSATGPVAPKPPTAGAAAAKADAHVPKAAAPVGPPDPPPPAGAVQPAFIEALQRAVPDSVSQVSYWVGDWTIIVPVSRLLQVPRQLRDAPGA